MNDSLTCCRVPPDSQAIVGRLDGDLFPAEVAELRRNDCQVVDERRAIDFEEIVETARGDRTYLSHKFPLFDAAGHDTSRMRP